MNGNKKIIIAAVSFVLAAALFSGLALYPVFQGVVTDHESLLALKRQLAEADADQENIRKFEALSAQYSAEFKRLETLRVDLDKIGRAHV